MPRSTWNGVITLGLINIPVGLFTSVRDDTISFRQLCPEHRARIQQQMFCSVGGERVESPSKGYELQPGEYVMLTDGDLERAALPMSKSFEIERFVPVDEVDLRYLDKPYVVLPDRKDPGKTYVLLREALRACGRFAVGRITLKTKQYPAVLRVLGDALVLQLLRWPGEVVPLDEFAFPSTDLKPAELDLARQLIEQLHGPFAPETFVNQHRANVMRIIEARMNEEEVPFDTQPEPARTDADDLLAILQASLSHGAPRAA